MSKRSKSFSASAVKQAPPALPQPIGYWKVTFWAVATLVGIAMPLLSLGYGVIWDEWIQSQYGKLVLKFLLSWGHDQSALKFGETMYLYGGLFDTLTAGVYGVLFDSIKNVSNYPLQADFITPHWHDTRHIINSLFGFSAILFTGLTARKIGSWRAGTFALLFLTLSPRFLGNSMNNPKDIPFAAAAAIFSYYVICLFKEIPKPPLKTSAGIILGLALALNIKAGGILFFCYLGLFVGIIWLQSFLSQSKSFSFIQLLKILIPICTLGYFAGLIFWPFGILNPLTHPIQALGAFSQFSGAQGTLLFEGLIYKHGETPWYYLLKWILISSPLFFTASIFLFFFLAKPLFSKHNKLMLSFLLFCGVFPLAYAILRNAIVYDSWRHFLFVYPPMIVLASLAWDHVFDQAASVTSKNTLLSTVLILSLFEPLGWMIQNHPHAYTYFNPLVGGLRGAYGRYETDYWGNCLRNASEKLVRHYQAKNKLEPVVIRADGEAISSYPLLVKGLGGLFIPFTEGKNNWKYSLELSRNRDQQTLRSGAWPGPHAVYVVSAENVPLCAVIEKK